VAQDGDIAEVEAPEELVAQVAAIDVAKASGMVCPACRTRPSRASAPPRYGRCRPPPTPSSSWPSSWPAKGSNASWPGSTSDYWRPLVYLLEARGLVVWLVNARDARAPAGPPQDR
jgi:transposase